jgi:formate-dependent nitrite reductase membrane component NrfD
VKAKNLAILFALSFAFISAGILFRLKVSHETYIRWGGLILTIGVIFGVRLKDADLQHPRLFHRAAESEHLSHTNQGRA